MIIPNDYKSIIHGENISMKLQHFTIVNKSLLCFMSISSELCDLSGSISPGHFAPSTFVISLTKALYNNGLRLIIDIRFYANFSTFSQ